MPFGTGAVVAMGTVLTIGGLAVLRKKKNNLRIVINYLGSEF